MPCSSVDWWLAMRIGRRGCSYRMKRGYVSEDTEARTFRYEPTNIIPASADVVMRWPMVSSLYILYIVICTDSAVDNDVDNLCITACITYADIHTIGVRGVQGGISTEKLDSFQQVFHTFIWSKDINLLTLQDIRRWCKTTFTVVIQPINIRHRCV